MDDVYLLLQNPRPRKRFNDDIDLFFPRLVVSDELGLFQRLIADIVLEGKVQFLCLALSGTGTCLEHRDF